MSELQAVMLTTGLSASFAAGGYSFATRRALRDIKGLSVKINKLVAMLTLWAETPEERKQVADIVAANGGAK